MVPLDPSAEDDVYLSDREYRAIPFRTRPTLSEFRAAINRIAMTAMDFADGARSEASHFANARDEFAQMQALAVRLRRLADRPVTIEAAVPFMRDEEEEPQAVLDEMEGIAAKADELALLLESFIGEREVGKAMNLTSGDPMRHQFFGFFADAWVEWTGKPVPRKGTGPFVELIVAAWTDLKLPESKKAAGFLSELARKHRLELDFA